MHIEFDGQRYDLIPLQQFRTAQGLPAEFGVAGFEPKDYAGLARMDAAGGPLNGLRAALAAQVPASLRLSDLMPLTDDLLAGFEQALGEINDAIGLHESELGFAVAGFGDVLNSYIYAMIRARQQQLPADFNSVYTAWLQGSTRLSAQQHPYTHQGQTWQVQILNNVYGRVGLCIHTEDGRVFVADHAYACPADGFMYQLLADLAQRIDAALG